MEYFTSVTQKHSGSHLVMDTFVDAHAHLVQDYDWKHLDHIAESGSVKQVWLLPVNVYQKKFEFASDDEVLKVGKRYSGLFLPFGQCTQTVSGICRF